MKKIKLILLLLPLLVLVGCVKQKDCECPYLTEGEFIYLKESYMYGSKEIKAHFISIQGVIEYKIYGSVPKKFQLADTVLTRACLKGKDISHKNKCDIKMVYSILCMEEREML